MQTDAVHAILWLFREVCARPSAGEGSGAGRDRPQPLRELSSSDGAFAARRRALNCI